MCSAASAQASRADSPRGQPAQLDQAHPADVTAATLEPVQIVVQSGGPGVLGVEPALVGPKLFVSCQRALGIAVGDRQPVLADVARARP